MHLEAEIKLNSEMHLEAAISEYGDGFGGRNRVTQICTWRP